MNRIFAAAAFAFLSSLAASGVWAQDDRDDHGGNVPELDIYGPVRLVLHDQSHFEPDGVVIPDLESIVVPIPRKVTQRNEDRINLRGLPVLGSLFNASADAEFSDARRVGEAFRSDEYIVIATGQAQNSTILLNGVRQVVIANRGLSYRMPKDFLRAAVPFLGDIPALGELFRMGGVYRKDDSLLIVVTPSLLDPEP